MEKVIITSRVPGDHAHLMERFNRQLFEFLLPPGAELKEFGGSETGHKVALRLPIVGPWVSIITDHGRNEKESYFIDEGTVLPFPLKKWKHIHKIKQVNEEECEIIDDMNFGTGYKLLDVLIKPFLFLAFYPRKKQYARYFT